MVPPKPVPITIASYAMTFISWIRTQSDRLKCQRNAESGELSGRSHSHITKAPVPSLLGGEILALNVAKINLFFALAELRRWQFHGFACWFHRFAPIATRNNVISTSIAAITVSARNGCTELPCPDEMENSRAADHHNF